MNAVYLGDSTALVRTVFGRKMYVDTRDTVVAPHLLLDGDWEPWIREFLDRVLQPGMSFIDVGAHLGWYTLFAKDRVGSQGHVVAFEPNEGHVELLRRSMMINGFSGDVVSGACSDTSGLAPYYCVPQYSGNGAITDSLDAACGSTVRCVRLDRWFSKTADFVKIDAEGHEPAVLRGMTDLFSKRPSLQLLVEHHAPAGAPETFGREVEELKKLVAMGFRMGVVEHDSHLSEVSVDELARVPDSQMLYLARPG